jgi:NAD(P)H-dependent FMN reductase
MPDEPPRVAGLAGSLREGSVSSAGLRTALEAAGEAGASTDLVDLRDLDLPLFDPEAPDPPGAVELRDRVGAADAVILATPMYHGSFSSPLKTALDHCGFEEFEGKTVGLLCASGGRFPITALDHLRSVCRALDAWVLPTQAAIPGSHDALDDEGRLADGGIRERVRGLGKRTVEFARIEPDLRTFEGTENVGAGGV